MSGRARTDGALKAVTLPFNLASEQALLGGILANNEAFDRVADFLQPNHFFLAPHARMFEVMGNLIRNGRQVTPVLLKTYLPADLRIDGQRTVEAYISFLLDEATAVVQAVDYGRTIYDLAIRRDLIRIAEEARAKAASADIDDDPRAQLEEIERRLFQLAEYGNVAAGFEPVGLAVTRTLDTAIAARANGGRLIGLSTGLADLDNQIAGLQAPDLIVLAGRPGMGKTALATNIATTVARAAQAVGQGGVGFFSLEMSAEQLAHRIVVSETRLDSARVRSGRISDEDLDRIRQANADLAQLPLYIDESGGLSLAQLVTRARRLKRQRGITLLVVDYLQLLHGSGRRQNDNRVLELAEITGGLKALAKELNIPVMVLSQLSRAVENREDKRPQLADLRESGAIEQDADIVLFLFREEYYNAMKRPSEADVAAYAEWDARSLALANKAEVIVAKYRHGPTGTVNLRFDKETTTFQNLGRIP